MHILIGTTVETKQEAKAIARACVEQGLVACAHIDEIESIYLWNSTVNEDSEYRVFLKSVEASYDRVVALIREHHSYDEPAIFTVPITGGSESYLNWISANSSGG